MHRGGVKGLTAHEARLEAESDSPSLNCIQLACRYPEVNTIIKVLGPQSHVYVDPLVLPFNLKTREWIENRL